MTPLKTLSYASGRPVILEGNEMKIVTGREYKIEHTRKGTFTAKVINDDPIGDGDWITIELTGGKVIMLTRVADQTNVGDLFDVRRSFCTFTELAS